MDLNSFLFPAPQSSYNMHNSIGDIIYIPRKWEPSKQASTQEEGEQHMNIQEQLTQPNEEEKIEKSSGEEEFFDDDKVRI